MIFETGLSKRCQTNLNFSQDVCCAAACSDARSSGDTAGCEPSRSAPGAGEFRMTGLYGLIPQSDCSPMPIHRGHDRDPP